jgi:glutamate racemase
MKRGPKLGIIDWGVGGIGVLKLVRSRLGNVPVVYFSDTGVTPYGRMTREQLVNRLTCVIGFMESRGVTHLAIGCNAASTALPLLATRDIRVEGVIDSAVRLTARMRPERLALIGGRRTVVSGVYRRALAARGIPVVQRIAQPLSALIETGDTCSPEMSKLVRRILFPIAHCSHLLLACTHYPAAISVLKQFVSRETVIIDPAAEMVRRIQSWNLADRGRSRFLTSGDAEKMKHAAWKAFGVRIHQAIQVSV